MTYDELLRRLREDVAAAETLASPSSREAWLEWHAARVRIVALDGPALVEELVDCRSTDGHFPGCLGPFGKPCSKRCKRKNALLDRCATALETP